MNIDIFKRLKDNYNGYLFEYRYYLIVLGLAALADMLTTIYFMLESGADAELHPVIRLVSYILGPVFGPVLGKICQFAAVLFITLYFRRWAKYFFITVSFLYFWAAWHNIWGQHIYTPRLIVWLTF